MDDYEALIELGIEGADRFVQKYHDKVYQQFDKRKLSWGRKKDKSTPARVRSEGPADDRDQLSASEGEDAPRGQRRRKRSRSKARPRSSSRSRPQAMHAPDRRRGRNWSDDDDDHGDGPYAPVGGNPDRGYYAGNCNTRGLSSRPYGYGRPRDEPYGDGFGAEDRGRAWLPTPYRSMSHSPVRREMRVDSPPRRGRVRSKSPKHHGAAATLVGALAGGLIGNAANKGGHGTLSTVAGAVIGGLGAREAEKMWDRHEDRKAEEEERRTRRRRGREYH